MRTHPHARTQYTQVFNPDGTVAGIVGAGELHFADGQLLDPPTLTSPQVSYPPPQLSPTPEGVGLCRRASTVARTNQRTHAKGIARKERRAERRRPHDSRKQAIWGSRPSPRPAGEMPAGKEPYPQG
jgi:hypothetical protein